MTNGLIILQYSNPCNVFQRDRSMLCITCV